MPRVAAIIGRRYCRFDDLPCRYFHAIAAMHYFRADYYDMLFAYATMTLITLSLLLFSMIIILLLS